VDGHLKWDDKNWVWGPWLSGVLGKAPAEGLAGFAAAAYKLTTLFCNMMF